MTSMRFPRTLTVIPAMLALMLSPVALQAQQATAPKPSTAAKPKSEPAKKPAPKTNAGAKPDAKSNGKSNGKPNDKSNDKSNAKADPPPVGGAQPTLLGQYGDWGAYTASPGGKKICFTIAKPVTTLPNGVNRDPAYMFISTRPADKVKEEVSIIMGYPTKPDVDAAAEVGSASFAMYTQKDGAWVKNATDEAKLVAALRSGAEVVIKGESGRGTKTTDTYSLKGLAQALDRAAQECK